MITLVPYHMELLVSVVLKKVLNYVPLKHLTMAESPHYKKSEHSLLSFPTVLSDNMYVIGYVSFFLGMGNHY